MTQILIESFSKKVNSDPTHFLGVAIETGLLPTFLHELLELTSFQLPWYCLTIRGFFIYLFVLEFSFVLLYSFFLSIAQWLQFNQYPQTNTSHSCFWTASQTFDLIAGHCICCDYKFKLLFDIILVRCVWFSPIWFFFSWGKFYWENNDWPKVSSWAWWLRCDWHKSNKIFLMVMDQHSNWHRPSSFIFCSLRIVQASYCLSAMKLF